MFGFRSGWLRGQSRSLIRDRWHESTDSKHLPGPCTFVRLPVSQCRSAMVNKSLLELTAGLGYSRTKLAIATPEVTIASRAM